LSNRSRRAGTPALVALAMAGVPHTVRAYQHDPRAHRDGLAYGAEAAAALGVPPDRVFKTLVAEVDGQLAAAVVPVDGRLDLKALAGALGAKHAAMAEAAVVQRSTGYVLGGISPFGQRRALATVVDASALDHTTVLVSAGRRGLDVEVRPGDLVALTAGTVAAIARRGP
jgi:Cys-tRNA(Pro)/Cys-tRNA(Cys) deacylase